MNLVKKGKTKDVYSLDSGLYVLKFKDDMTGTDGVFDPGANTVGLTMDGAGKAGLAMSTFLFEYLNKKGVPTHYVCSNLDAAEMTVKSAKHFGEGIEVICRYKAVGSFIRRYGMYAKDGQDLDAYVEITLKDDERGDPPIIREGLAMLKIMTESEYDIVVQLTKTIAGYLKEFLASLGMILYDIKFEFGRTEDGTIVLIDELSGGNMRVYKDGKSIQPLELASMIIK